MKIEKLRELFPNLSEEDLLIILEFIKINNKDE
jgi:hypothetical protein